jgi:hypothetical protein
MSCRCQWLILNSWKRQSFRLSLYTIFPYLLRPPTTSASFCFIIRVYILFRPLLIIHSIPKSNPLLAVLNFIIVIAFFLKSTNYKNKRKVFGNKIVASCRFKLYCATCYKTPSVSSTVSQILVTEMLRDTFSLCSRNLVTRHLQSVFSKPCHQIPSVCVLETLSPDTFSLRFQHLVLTNFQSVFSVSCSRIPSICVFSISFLEIFNLCS